MNAHLFVYGSLMSAAGHQMGAKLAGEARLLGPATIGGRLFRVSWYPGVIDASDPAHKVHGEVYRLADAAGSLTWLDAYEGITPGNEETAQYCRVERLVRLASGEEMLAWVYLYRKPTAGLSEVPDGRWASAGR